MNVEGFSVQHHHPQYRDDGSLTGLHYVVLTGYVTEEVLQHILLHHPKPLNDQIL